MMVWKRARRDWSVAGFRGRVRGVVTMHAVREIRGRLPASESRRKTFGPVSMHSS